jgi:hypothetical protein
MTSWGDQVLTTKGRKPRVAFSGHARTRVRCTCTRRPLPRQVSGAALRFAEQLRIATGRAMALFSPKEKGASAASPFSPTNTDSHFIFQKKDKTNRRFSAERGGIEN